MPDLRLFFFLLFLVSFSLPVCAQLCQGSLGDPVVNITFGSGDNPGEPLDAAATNYRFIRTDCPQDGAYTIRNSTSGCFNNAWHTITDHTGDGNGYFMLVNASFEPSDFYLGTVKDLCGGTTYEFAAWINNVLIRTGGIRPNITFSIEKADGTVLQTFNTGDIDVVTGQPQWKQYGFYFNTPADVFEVVLRIRNNAPGGGGNDLALDDITFRPCGPLVTAAIDGVAREVNICDGNTEAFNFKSAISAGYNAPAYQWQTNTNGTWQDIPGANTDAYQRLPTSRGTYQYRLTVANAGNLGISSCRIASSIITINVRSNPSIVLTNDGPQCEGGSLKIAGKVIYNAAPGTYSWSGPGLGGAVIYNETVDNNVGAYEAILTKSSLGNAAKFYFTAANIYGCRAIDSTTPVLYNKPVAGFTMPASGCQKLAVAFADASTVVGQTITKWNWNFGDGASAAEKNTSHSFASEGDYPVKLIVETDKGCKSDTAIKNLRIHQLPTANFVLPEICLADPYASFIDSSRVSDNSQQPFSYLWNFGDPAGGTLNTSVLKDPQHKYSSIGNYNVRLTVTTVNGCMNDTAKIFTVNGSLPKADFTVGNSSKLCSNEEVSITNNSTVDFGSVTKVEIFWDQNNPAATTLDNNPSPGKKYIFRYAAQANANAASYVIRYRAYSGINCVNESMQPITVNASPQVSFLPVNGVCEEALAYKITANEVTGITGNGQFTGDGIDVTGLFTPAAASPGEHTIKYTYTTNVGCLDTGLQKIIVYPQPVINAGNDLTVLKGTSVTLKATATGTDIKVLWTPATYLDNPAIINPKTTPLNEILYKLVATSSMGCINEDELLVQVVDKLYIPNAFTPDGDGINDVWLVPYFNSLTDIDVKIFNRYGQLVFHTVKENKPWDGKFNGQMQQSGAYVYVVESKGNNIKATGTLILIR